MLKKLIKMGVVMSLLVTSVSAFAQNSGKIEYPRYSFGSNWSFGFAPDLTWEMGQHGDGEFHRSFNAGADLTFQKKFHHAFDLRARIHMPTWWSCWPDYSDTPMTMARYWNVTGEVMWSLSNALHGYDPDRTWSAPYFFAGAGATVLNWPVDDIPLDNTRYGQAGGNVRPVLTLGIGASWNFSEHWGLFGELELNANDIPHPFHNWTGIIPDWDMVHGDARIGIVYNAGLTEADKAVASQKSMLTQDNFGALNSQVAALEQQVANNRNEEKKLQNRIAELEKQLADAMANKNNKVNSAAADSLQNVINQIKADQLNYYALPFSVLYGVDEWQVTDEEMEKVKAVARVMKDNSNVKIKVVGFADYTGSAAYNMKLSERRANEVKRLLSKKYGIDEDRIEVDFKGKDAPFGDAQYALNRRVSFYRVIE